jgi:hypothetical protein
MRSTWTPRNTYLYVVCLITLIMMIIGTVNVIRSTTELLYPQPRAYPSLLKGPEDPALDAETEARLMAEQREAETQWSRRQAVISIVGGAALLLIAAPLYRYHWREVQRARENDVA